VPKLDDADTLFLFAAGREARIYAVPPHTTVEPLAFEDREFTVERFPGESCHACGSTDTYLVEVSEETGAQADGDGAFETRYACNDSSFCAKRRETPTLRKDHHLDREGVDWGPGTPGGGPSADAGEGTAAEGGDDE
jgi:alpha-D-ribose 1-methylphosphonate 5-phosphate C-P lyase